MQMRRGIFNVKVLVLTRPAFGRNHATAVGFFEITTGKLVTSLDVLGFLVIDAQYHFTVFFKSVA